MIPFPLGRAAAIESADPIRHKLVKVWVSPAGIQLIEPKGGTGTAAPARSRLVRYLLAIVFSVLLGS
jgi:hypothetical protein